MSQKLPNEWPPAPPSRRVKGDRFPEDITKAVCPICGGDRMTLPDKITLAILVIGPLLFLAGGIYGAWK